MGASLNAPAATAAADRPSPAPSSGLSHACRCRQRPCTSRDVYKWACTWVSWRAGFAKAGRAWCLHVVMGEAADCILNAIGRLQPQGVVLGRRGLNAAQSLLLGSVTDKVLQEAQVPVLVVP